MKSHNLQEAVNRHLAANKLTPKTLGARVGLSDFTIRAAAKQGKATQATVEKLSREIDSVYMAQAVHDFFPGQAPVSPFAGLDADPKFEDVTPPGTTTVNLDDYPGAVAARKNRTTKTRIVIIDRANGVRANPKDLEKRWEVVCIDHGSRATTGDRAVANYGATYSWSWCKGCKAIAGDAPVRLPYPDQPHRSL